MLVEEARRSYANCHAAAAELIRFFGIPQVLLAEAMDMSEQRLSDRLLGKTEIKGWEADVLAKLLGVPGEVLRMERREALRWALDHPEARPLVKCLHT